jgi:two-component sensor histidine kinase
VKNNLALILSLAQQTSDRVSSLDDFMPAFTGRIQSLAIVHEMLAHARWEGIDLESLARQILEPYVRVGPERLPMRGPALLLPTLIATSLCMVLNELATNAAKYGALSGDRGRVELTWTLAGDAENRLLEMTWQEIDGPPVTSSAQAGFGMRLIEGLVRRQMRGDLDLVFDTTGVQCRLRVPYRLEDETMGPRSGC